MGVRRKVSIHKESQNVNLKILGTIKLNKHLKWTFRWGYRMECFVCIGKKKGFSITTTATWAKGIFNEIFILFLLFENLHKKIKIKIKRRELKKKQFFKFFFDFFFLDVNND